MKTLENASYAEMIIEDKKLMGQILAKLCYRMLGCAAIMLELGVQLGIQIAIYINN